MTTVDPTATEIAEDLAAMCHAAKREIPKHRVSELHDDPTPWDLRHRGLDLLLDDYQRAKAGQPA